jgi:hypothetical protein
MAKKVLVAGVDTLRRWDYTGRDGAEKKWGQDMDAKNYEQVLREDIERQYRVALDAIEAERKRKLDALGELFRPFAGVGISVSGGVEDQRPQFPQPPLPGLIVGRAQITQQRQPMAEVPNTKSGILRSALASIDGVVSVNSMRAKIAELYGSEMVETLRDTVRSFIWQQAQAGKLVKIPSEGQMILYKKAEIREPRMG